MPLYTLGPEFAPEVPADGGYWLAPNATVIGKVRLAREVSVWFGATIRGDTEPITVGERCNIQDNSVLHTDSGIPLVLGRSVTVGHMAMVHGATIGDNCLIGIGAILLNRAQLGRNCIVGAGALVTEGKSFPDNSLVMGAPARVVRQVSDEEAQLITAAADHYVQNWKRFASDLKVKRD